MGREVHHGCVSALRGNAGNTCEYWTEPGRKPKGRGIAERKGRGPCVPRRLRKLAACRAHDLVRLSHLPRECRPVDLA